MQVIGRDWYISTREGVLLEKTFKMRRNFPAVLKALDASDDERQIELYENILTAMIGAPILLLVAAANIIIRNLLWHESYQNTLFGSIIFILLAALFELVTRIQIKPRLMTHFISLIIAVWFMFIILYFFNLVGPAVLTMGFIQIAFALTRENKTVLVYISMGSLLTGIHLWIARRNMSFVLDDKYYAVQFALFFLLFIVAAIILKVNKNRHGKTQRLLEEALRQKEETLSLYEEIAANEEELRTQNEQLRTYNEQILEKEAKLNYISNFDILTGLPNRQMILERLQLLIRLSHQKQPIYIVFFDLDNFKQVNDTLGYRAGDNLLIEVTEILIRSIHPDDLAGRLGGDEFVLLLQQPMDENNAFRFIDEIRERISEINIADAPNICTSASFGVTVYPFDGEEEIELMKCADTAMYKAKETGRNNIQFYRKEMKEEILQKIEREKQLLDAIKNNEFFLVFQPQFSVDGRYIRGFEALIRWRSPHGIVDPMDFIPLAERTGLILLIGRWVLRTACFMFQDLCERLSLDALISVNISAAQIRQKNFVQSVMDILKETQLDPCKLELEITETMLIDSLEETVELLKKLKALGVHVSLDDFGTGYSSLNYLKILPIDTLKIDKTFIHDITAAADSGKMLGDMIHLAHHLNLLVVAEGVETEEQLEYLVKKGCDYAQGYLLGRPVEMTEIQKLLENKLYTGGSAPQVSS